MKQSLSSLTTSKKGHTLLAQGMSLVEMIIAMGMLVLFGAVFISVAEVTLRFVRESESSLPGSQGLLIDQHDLQIAMDQLVDVMSQPGLSLSDLSRIQSKGCVFDPMSGSLELPTGGWGLPGPALSIPPGYRFCLHSTSLAESALSNLLSSQGRPGIYVIQALPDSISPSSLPSRRLFCRPKPFC